MQNSNIHKRKSYRLQSYDYSQNGSYFITICTKNRKSFFGIFDDESEFKYSQIGKIAEKYWYEITYHYPDVLTDAFIVMPDHIHGILTIKRKLNDSMKNQFHSYQHTVPRSVGAIIRGYKIGVTKWARTNTPLHTIWQRNYYERVIRNEQSLHNIRIYIYNNRKYHICRGSKS